ncbi:NAD(P)H-binding protein [Kribbella sp. NPDC051770]|uniref:SDR family oxidoreductase n=1 Tax=Kribbella sp. NPDC051770 TaxID=3155413 RepID=UPI00341E0023
MTILITGGRGKIARAVATGLVSAGRDVRIASRSPQDLPGAVAFDATDPASVAAALDGISQVFLYAEPSTAGLFAAAADAAGVQQVVLLSSMSSHADNDDAAGDPHAETELIVGSGAYATTYLQPGAFMSNALFWSHAIRATGQVRLPYLDAEEAPIHEQDIADVAVRVLLDGPGGDHDGRGYPLTGPESMTRRAQLAQVASVTGVAFEAVDLTPSEARVEMGAVMRRPAQLEALLSYWASRVGTPHPIEPTVEKLTAQPGRTFRTWLRDHADAF